jgi:hypothetical protein
MELLGKKYVAKTEFAVYFSAIFITFNCSQATGYDIYFSQDVSLQIFTANP